MRKTVIRFFTIADYEDEEIWLREQHRSGWKMVGMTPPCFYVFESCAPQDVIYRLDFLNADQTDEYMQMAADFGWEYYAKCVGWLYFRKPAETVEAEGDDELFSDNASRVEIVGHIVRTRLVPIALIFLCCVIPNLLNSIRGTMYPFSGFFGGFFGFMFVVYVYLIVHCSLKLKQIRDKYQN